MMERFAINILHKRIYKICRLCGVDQPHKIPIIDGAETILVGDEDEEASLAKKIEECVGIQVHKDDKMPQNICALCVDKINDFYEYRLMCAATNLQTRSILNLNLVEPSRKLLNFGEVSKVEDVKKEDVKKVVEVATSSSNTIIPTGGKKGKKKRGPPSPSPSPAPPTTRIKAPVDVKDEPVPAIPVKALTKKERMKQLQLQKEKDEKKKKDDEKKKKEDEKKDKKDDKLKKEKVEAKAPEVNEQKHTRSKRKEPSPPKEVAETVEQTVPPPKKIKFEHPCSYCTDEFKTETELAAHLVAKHTPSVRKFGCGSCRETFETVLESKDHNLWHQLTRTLYTCFKCKRKYDKNLALVKHMSLNACGRVARGRPPALHPDVQCRLCSKKFKTQNLYEWHGCFLKPKCNCPKCGKYFVKRQILIRHYMMYCTGTLPPPEPVIIPKVEPVDPAEKPAAATTVATEKPDRRKRRVAFAEPELPKEEREIPFPPPLEPEAAASSPAPTPTPAPSGSKKKNKKDSTPTVTIKPVPPPPAQTEKITSLLTSGAKLDRDSDITTINNLLSSVTEAIASISEAKAKKKKKKKDKNKDKAETESSTVEEQKKDPAPPEPKEPTPPPPAVEEKTEEDLEAYALAQEVGEMTLDQQLAFCSGKLPLVVLAKTTFKQEYTEIDTEPSQMQEPMAENGEDDGYDDAGNDYSGFQDDDDNEEEPAEQEEAPAAEQNQQTEELEFPRPIKQEVEPEEPTIAPETPQQEEAQSPQQEETDSPRLEATQTPQPEEPTQPTVVAAPKPAKEPESLFDEQLAITIKKEPGLEEEPQQPAAKRKRPESRASAAPSPASPVSSSRSAPQESPKLILKINKGMLNSATESTRAIKTIVLDDDDDDDEEDQRLPEPSEASKKTKVYKKPDFLAVKIKQEKVDPAYERVETPTVVSQAELPGGIRIKQERLDPDEEPAQQYEEEEQAPPPQKKSRLSRKDKPASPIVAFDGVRIKQEKPDAPQPDVEMPPSIPAPEDPKPAQDKKKKSKGKINPFALLRQKMAAEAAAKAAAGSAPPQAPSPLPVITNVVGNAPTTSTSSASSSGENTPLAESDSESDRRVPVIAQVASIAAEKVSAPEFPIAIKQEPVDEPEEEHQQEHPHAEAEEESPENDFPMPIKQEIPDEPPKVSEESPSEAEESDFPVPIKEEQLESPPESSESETRQQDEEPVAKDVAEEKEPETPSSTEEEQSDEKGDDEGEADDHKSVPSSVQEEEQGEDEEHDEDEKETVQKSEDEKEESPAEAATKDQNDEEEEEEEDDEKEGEESAGAAVEDTVVPSEEHKADQIEEDEDDGEEEEEEESSSPVVEEKKDSVVPSEEEEANPNEEDGDDGEEEENEESSSLVEEEKKDSPKADEEQNEKDEDNDGEEQEESPSLAAVEEKAEPPLENEEQRNSEDPNEADEHEDDEEGEESPSDVVKENVDSPPKVNKIDQNDQDKEDEHEEKEQNVAGRRVENEEVTEQKEQNNIDERIERSDVPDQNEPLLNDEPENSTSPISDIPMDDYDQNSLGQENLPFKSQEPQQESVAVVEPPPITEAPKPSSTSDECADARLESQLEELQNLLTGGLKPLPDPTQLAQDSSFVPSSSVQNMVQSSSTGLSSVENNVGISGLEDDLDSLLNNKLEEIKAAQPLSSLPPQDDLNMVIERELLHEMMPISDNGNNSLLGVGQDLLLDGSGNSGQQSS
ncbi:titin [Aedes aegypti]|uniref:Uncharacterized protein n=1 Tax=Aedes aegypti TaxID=7159 RepID=A0A1S4F473_AEDAE|nr:titin [Aedes aegypti]